MSEIKIIQSFVVNKTESVSDFKILKITRDLETYKLIDDEKRLSVQVHLVSFPEIKTHTLMEDVMALMEKSKVKIPSKNIFLGFGEQHYGKVKKCGYINSLIGFLDPADIDVPKLLYLSLKDGFPFAKLEEDNCANTYGPESLFLVEKK